MAKEQVQKRATTKERVNRFLEKFRTINPYAKYKYFAQYLKVRIQMFIGIILIIFMVLNIINVVFGWTIPYIENIVKMQILEIVAGALYLSTAIELAYTLFTPDLDEAVEPVITGLAATILLSISKIKELKDVSLDNAGGIAFLGLVMAILFVIRNKFLQEEESKQPQEAPAEDKDKQK